MDRYLKGWMNGQTDDNRIEEQMSEWLDGWKDKLMDGQMDVWMGE